MQVIHGNLEPVSAADNESNAGDGGHGADNDDSDDDGPEQARENTPLPML